MTLTCSQRVDVLERVFTQIARTRMDGVPVQNPALRVQAVGFATSQADDNSDSTLVGVLITPWFMNLVRLPELMHQGASTSLAPGCKALRRVGAQGFEFIGAFEEELGAFEACSLFSPMFEFADHQAALATATEVLTLLRKPLTADSAPAIPSRRGFLFGRSSVGGSA